MRPIEKLPAVEAVTPQAGPHRDATIEDEMSELDIDKYHNFSREAAEEETIEAAIRVARRPIQRNARKARRWRLERRTAPLNRIVQPDGDTQYLYVGSDCAGIDTPAMAMQYITTQRL